MKFTHIDQVWNVIDQGQDVYWCNESYKLTIEPTNNDYRLEHGLALPFSNRDGQCLRVTCVSNWFGSLLLESEISNLFVK